MITTDDAANRATSPARAVVFRHLLKTSATLVAVALAAVGLGGLTIAWIAFLMRGVRWLAG